VSEQVIDLGGLKWYALEDDEPAIQEGIDLIADVGVEGGTIFDFGCGVGGFAISNAARGAKVVAVDPSRERIEQVKRTARLNDVGLYVLHAALAPHDGELPVVTLDFLCRFIGYVPDIIRVTPEADVFNDPAIHSIPLIVGSPPEGDLVALLPEHGVQAEPFRATLSTCSFS
jgi:SAM-dependent methyltransferase